MQKPGPTILCYLALTACLSSLFVVDEFGVAVPLIIVLIAIGLWFKHKPAPDLRPARNGSQI